MSRLIFLLVLVALAWVVWPEIRVVVDQLGVSEAGLQSVQAPPASAPPLPEAPMPRDPSTYRGTRENMGGVVTGVTPTTLRIRRVTDGQPWVFEAGLWLGSKHGPRQGYSYRFDDLHIGDHVTVGYECVGDVSIAQNLCLSRRPGGRIPPEPWTAPHDTSPWHARMQAHQDREEKELPMPDRGAFPRVPVTINGVVTPESIRKALIELGMKPPPPPLIDN